MRLLSLSATLGCSVLALSACGGPDPAEYVQQVRVVQQAAIKDANTANTAMAKARSARDVQRLLQRVGSDFSEHAAELGTITPPDEVAADHRAYVKMFAKYGRSFRSLGERFGRSKGAASVNKLQAEAQQLTRSLAAQESAIVDRVNRKLAD